MKHSVDLAEKFLLLAQRDAYALRLLMQDDGVAAEVIGFHAQQVVEKSLKAVLMLHSIVFRKTHALDALLDLLKDAQLPVPPHEEKLEDLTPYAVLWRYDFNASEDVNRNEVAMLVAEVYQWAEACVASASRGV